MKSELIQPIKKAQDRLRFKHYWYTQSSMGPRNWLMFRVGMITALPSKAFCAIKRNEIYREDGQPNNYISSVYLQTHYPNNIYVKPLRKDLERYQEWLHNKGFKTPWLFPVSNHPQKHVDSQSFYITLKRASKAVGLPYVGISSLKKTFGYLAYKKTHDMIYVMRMLRQQSPTMTLRYIDIPADDPNEITKKIFS